MKIIDLRLEKYYNTSGIFVNGVAELFRTNDKVNLFFQITAVALSIAIVVLGILYGVWMWFFDGMTGDYTANATVDINSGAVITEVPNTTALPQTTAQKNGTSTLSPTATPDMLKENILAWRNTGTPAGDSSVTNILLIGIDVETKDMNVNSRADAMVILSLNHRTRTITLASVMRDQYAYVEVGTHKAFEKIHHANMYGGPEAQIQMIEQYYKVALDNYALVNFYSLPKIIDRLDGVTVNITATEAAYLNDSCGQNVTAGENTLNGDQALLYMRIRHQTGGDEARVNRQQNVIKEIIKKLGDESSTGIIQLMADIKDYIRTGYTAEKMIALAGDALTNGWFNYSIRQVSFPDSTCATDYTVDDIWYWKVDYPLAAQKLQLALYGTTNIQLSENRKSWLD